MVKQNQEKCDSKELLSTQNECTYLPELAFPSIFVFSELLAFVNISLIQLYKLLLPVWVFKHGALLRHKPPQYKLQSANRNISTSHCPLAIKEVS